MNLNKISKDMTKNYCGNVVYDSGERMLLTDEGYVTFAADGTPQYHYYLKDHLGNVRVVMGQTGEVEQVNHYYAFGSLMRESSNPGVQPYKYGGKELDRYSGLDAYDFGARAYFSDRMQWSTMDPLCEKYYDVSPYAYCGNNPVMYIDPMGMDYWSTNDTNMIREFWENVNSNNFNNIDYTEWNHSTDADFLANLHYNDKTNKYYYSYGTIENGEVVCYSQSFSGKMVDMEWWSTLGDGNTSLGTALGAAEYKLGNKINEANKYIFRTTDGFLYNSTAPKVKFRNIAQDFKVSSVAKLAKGIKIIGGVSGGISAFMIVKEMKEGKKHLIGEGGLDLIMTGVGFIPGYGWMVSGSYFLVKYGMEMNQWDFWNNR